VSKIGNIFEGLFLTKLIEISQNKITTRMWPTPNVLVALPKSNIGGALCSTPQSLADAHY